MAPRRAPRIAAGGRERPCFCFWEGLARRRSILAFALGAASPAFATIDLVGASEATFTWQPATGPVSGYVVYQLCTNGPTPSRTRRDQPGDAARERRAAPSACRWPRTRPPDAQAARAALGSVGAGSLPAGAARRRPLARAARAGPGTAVAISRRTSRRPGAASRNPSRSRRRRRAPTCCCITRARAACERWSVAPSGLTRRSRRCRQFSVSARVVGNGDYDGDGFADLLALDARPGVRVAPARRESDRRRRAGRPDRAGREHRRLGRLRRRRRLGRAGAATRRPRASSSGRWREERSSRWTRSRRIPVRAGG